MMNKSMWLAAALLAAAPFGASAQTGVDDDRVSLPGGPGSLEGVGDNVSVNPNMALMSYQVQIETPRGFPGLSPELALGYSSGAGSGVAGIGWSFSTPTIERMTSKGVPLYDATDRFAADGSDELVPVADADGAKVYRARYERAFVRYTWTGAGNEGWWKAEYPDGRVGWFGADQNGQIVAAARSGAASLGTWRYHVVDVVDPYGNRIHYDYDHFDGAVPLVTAVSYVYAGDTPRYVVRLSYEDRPDLLSDAGSGEEEVLRYRLASAKVFTAGELTREYVLDYQDMGIAGGASRLRTVRTYGVGGAAGGQLLPAQFSFDYSRALGADCEGNEAVCARPFVVDMGVLQGAVNMAGGAATLVDINGDGLPDVLDTSGNGPHRFYLNTLTPNPDGSFAHGFSAPIESRVAEGDTFHLTGHNVQEMDLNGDGYSDLVNTATGAYLLNAGHGSDWAEADEGLDVVALPDFGSDETFAQLRFMDYDNDKRIDIIASTSDTTSVYVNDGQHFTRRQVDPIGAGFATANLQLADMNGDGLNDPVEVMEGGAVRYRLNLGRGHWSEWRVIPGLDVDASELPFLDLEDLNGDSLNDVVIVTPSEIKYALNRNADHFDPFRTVTADDVEGELPERSAGVGVLYADMNANGSQDIVWFDPNGHVHYLELFPERPNLLTRIENHLGMVQKVAYETSVEQAARATAAGTPWDVSLPYPMNVVASTDTFATLTGADDGTGVHEVDEYTYRNGFYDGMEKQFRGFTNVSVHQPGDDFQEEGLTELVYDDGQQDDHRNGLLLSRKISSAGHVLNETTWEYDDCPVAEVPTPQELMGRGLPAVRWVCEKAEQVVHEEGAAQADWVTTRKETTYDGYGNATLEADLGIVARGGQACGMACEGDERYVETAYVAPTNFWNVGLPARRSTYTRAADPLRTDERFYYDGDAFVGLPEGQATHGFLSRATEKVRPDADEVVNVERQRATEHGQVAESIDPNGDPADQNAHRRLYEYDDAGLLVTGVTFRLTDPEGQPYELRSTYRYDDRFQSISEATEHVLYRNGQPASAINTTRYRYDALGHIAALLTPGDTDDAPSQRFAYEFGDPTSRVAIRERLDDHGAERLTIRCFDGRGRAVQDRVQIGPNKFQVSGFDVFNRRGEVVQSYQPYVATSDACEMAPPADVPHTDYRRDALGRSRMTTEPDAALYGGAASASRTEYEPMAIVTYDAEDADPQSPHHDTPTREIIDGLGRPVALERQLAQSTARWNLTYDNLGNLATVTDPDGQVQSQTFDLLGRAVSVQSPHHGTVTLAWDAAGNVVSRTDGRGKVERREYDGVNRLVARYDDADPMNTTTRFRFDADPDCAPTECTNTAGEIASVTYPVGIAGIDAGEDRFGYDARGREVFAARRLGDVDLPVHRTFDLDDRATGLAYPDGTNLDLHYDGLGRLTSVTGFFNPITWDDRGDLAGVTYGNGVQEARTYDADRRLATLTVNDAAGTPVLGLAFRYDRDGNVREITDQAASRPGARSRALRVDDDDWYRPTTIAYGQDEEVDSTYDVLDGVRTRTSSLGADSAANVGDLTYDDAHHTRVTSAGDVQYTYDDAGYVTKRGEQTLTWDFQGRLVGARSGDAVFQAAYGPEGEPVVTLDDGALTLYGFDDFEVRDGVACTYVRVDDRRAARRATPGFGTHVYPDLAPAGDDGSPAPDGTISAADAWIAWARASGVVGGGDPGADVDLLLEAAARRVVAENADATAYLHADDLDNIVAATDEGGEVTGLRDFFPYGAPRWETGYVDPYGYTGQQVFASTGLIHFRHRQLDPWSGRWMSPDPAYDVLDDEQVVGDPSDALTGYAYVGNDTLSKDDPSGLKGEKKKTVKKARKPKKEKAVTHVNAERKGKILRGTEKPTKAELRSLSPEERKRAKSNYKDRKAADSFLVRKFNMSAQSKSTIRRSNGTSKFGRKALTKAITKIVGVSVVFAGVLAGGIYGVVKAPNTVPSTPYLPPPGSGQNNSSQNNSSPSNSSPSSGGGSQGGGDTSGGGQ